MYHLCFAFGVFDRYSSSVLMSDVGELSSSAPAKFGVLVSLDCLRLVKKQSKENKQRLN